MHETTLIITIQVRCPSELILGVKESIAVELEKYGDVKVLSVEQAGQRKRYEQMKL